MQAERVAPKEAEKVARQSRYIAQLKQQADDRKREEVGGRRLRAAHNCVGWEYQSVRAMTSAMVGAVVLAPIGYNCR